jgi:hypothetical protein
LLVSGSRTSGGFNIIKPETLEPSKITRTRIDPEKNIIVSVEWLDCLGLNPGIKLLVGGGSGLGPAFIAGGAIYKEALEHNELTEYE